jgi:hypothetical protein
MVRAGFRLKASPRPRKRGKNNTVINTGNNFEIT